jgi:hypothetical protein
MRPVAGASSKTCLCREHLISQSPPWHRRPDDRQYLPHCAAHVEADLGANCSDANSLRLGGQAGFRRPGSSSDAGWPTPTQRFAIRLNARCGGSAGLPELRRDRHHASALESDLDRWRRFARRNRGDRPSRLHRRHRRERPGCAGAQRGLDASTAAIGLARGRSLRIDFLWGQGLPDVIRRHAAELGLAAVLLALLKLTAADGHHSLRA